MRLIRTEEASAGMKVARSVIDLRGNLLFGAGAELTAETLAGLKKRGITHIFVEDGGTPPAQPPQSPRKPPEEIAEEVNRMFAGLEGNPLMAALREAAKRYLISRAK